MTNFCLQNLSSAETKALAKTNEIFKFSAKLAADFPNQSRSTAKLVDYLGTFVEGLNQMENGFLTVVYEFKVEFCDSFTKELPGICSLGARGLDSGKRRSCNHVHRRATERDEGAVYGVQYRAGSWSSPVHIEVCT